MTAVTSAAEDDAQQTASGGASITPVSGVVKGVTNIDFKRGPNGEGRVIVDLTSTAISTDVWRENNIVNVLGNTVIEATSDINLYATEGIGGKDRAKVTGSVLSLSLVPYAVEVDTSKASVTSNNQVNIAGSAYLEAGINNQVPFYILPIGTTSGQPGIDLPDDVDPAALETGGVPLTSAHKIEFGLADVEADLEFEAVNLDQIGFFVFKTAAEQ